MRLHSNITVVFNFLDSTFHNNRFLSFLFVTPKFKRDSVIAVLANWWYSFHRNRIPDLFWAKVAESVIEFNDV